MEVFFLSYLQLFMDTFLFLLWVYQQWWAWAFVAIPAIVISVACMVWMSILTAPIWLCFNGIKSLLNIKIGGKQ